MGLGQYQGGEETLSSITDSKVEFGGMGGIMGPRFFLNAPILILSIPMES